MDAEVGDATEIAHVACHQLEAAFQRCGGDERVRDREMCVATKAPGPSGDLRVNADLDVRQKETLYEDLLVFRTREELGSGDR